MRKFFFIPGVLFIAVLLIQGCSNRATATIDPTTDLSSIKSIYVVKLAPDGRGINRLIADKLKTMGYRVSTGITIPSNVDVVVTYKDRWMWDITMYMLELTVIIRDPKTEFPLATGNSFHTSLTRKSPEEMVDEVINNIFKQAKQ
ncbi:MAG TPA: hypothetical protein ENI65_11995 [Gammaproteobacteria bacterium]|nr:hypothetical protein [Gammaproteobacteria bacterium]